MAWRDVISHPTVRKVLQEGEERLGRTVGKLLADERVAGGVQRLLQGAFRARDAVERGVGRALHAANVPSRDDVEALRRRIEELEAMLDGARARPGRGGRRDGNGNGQGGGSGGG
jgi:BMFP domain-containing protein YqiC